MENRPFIEEWCKMWSGHGQKFYESLTSEELLKHYDRLLAMQAEKMEKGESK